VPFANGRPNSAFLTDIAPTRLAEPAIQPSGSKRAREKNPRQKQPGWNL
jgi:hypothetical protein